MSDELRVSRDCTAEDLAVILPDWPEADREAFLAGHRDQGHVVTYTEVVMDGAPVDGLVIGPAGSEAVLRRPVVQDGSGGS